MLSAEEDVTVPWSWGHELRAYFKKCIRKPFQHLCGDEGKTADK